MEFLKNVRKKSFLSEVVYILLNVALAISIVVLVRATQSLWPAIGLVLLSKWRVFGVRPRYWFVNIQSNLVDFIVSVSLAVFLYTIYSGNPTSGEIVIAVALMLLYIGWLLYIKPRSRRSFVVAQAGIALFTGTAALYMYSYAMPASLVVVFMWLIGYSTARHALASYGEETHVLFMSQVWGLMMAELGWLAYHWTVAYPLFGSIDLLVPRFALTVLCLGFVALKAYDSYHKNQKIRGNDIIMPLLFAFGIIIVLPLVLNLLGFSVALGV